MRNVAVMLVVVWVLLAFPLGMDSQKLREFLGELI